MNHGKEYDVDVRVDRTVLNLLDVDVGTGKSAGCARCGQNLAWHGKYDNTDVRVGARAGDRDPSWTIPPVREEL